MNKENKFKDNTYLEVTYGHKEFTSYPSQLAKHLFEKYDLKSKSKILDLGCGRGEFLRGFIDCGMQGYGFDMSDSAKNLCHDAEIKVGDLNERLPYDDNFFDVIYSKSVIEHLYYPEKITIEANRILKPGGLIITMCPNWEYFIKDFWDDFTHRCPFTKNSLMEVHKYAGFRDVEVSNFIQLPIIWKYEFLKPLTFLARNLIPDKIKMKSKFIRFSKEIMLIATAFK